MKAATSHEPLIKAPSTSTSMPTTESAAPVRGCMFEAYPANGDLRALAATRLDRLVLVPHTPELAADVGTSVGAVSMTIARMRDSGVDLPRRLIHGSEAS